MDYLSLKSTSAVSNVKIAEEDSRVCQYSYQTFCLFPTLNQFNLWQVNEATEETVDTSIQQTKEPESITSAQVKLNDYWTHELL